MKRLLNIIITFFTFTLFLLLEPNVFQVQSIDSVNYIQNVNKETVVLVSNNILNSEITSLQQKNDQNFSGSTPLILAYQPINSLLNKNKTQLNGSFIHNLSTNRLKIHQIRAP